MSKQIPSKSFIWKIWGKASHKTYYQAIVNIFQKTEATYVSSQISITFNYLISYMACQKDNDAYPNW